MKGLGMSPLSFLASTLVGLAQQERLLIAESCTGGRLCSAIARVPGASAVWMGGVVVYSNEMKTRLLGVSPDLLAIHGAVSRETALAMADGACDLHGATLAAAITGVAGPGGGSPEKPAGCVFVALRHGQIRRVRRFLFDAGAGRAAVQESAARAALLALVQELAMGAAAGFETMPSSRVDGAARG